MKLLIIADDFTGALDTGVQLSKHSIRTIVMSNPDTVPSLEDSCQVLVINAGFRHAKPRDAYACIVGLLHRYQDEFTHIYLKTDSVLRGNISAAFAAALHTLKKPLCFIPAFPDLKRTTRLAYAYVDGVLLENSVFKDDPRTPTLESNIPDIVNHEYHVNCQSIPPENHQLFTKASLKNDTVYIFDCETDAQLDTIGDLLAREHLYEFTAGCAGFASTFASHLPFEKTAFEMSKSSGPVLFVSGSASAVTLEQLEYAGSHGYTVLPLSEIMFSSLAGKEAPADKICPKAYAPFAEQAAAQLRLGRSIILATAAGKKDLFSSESIPKAFDNEIFLHNYIARFTSSLVKSILDEMDQSGQPLHNLAVFGGDMAAAILEQLSCHQLGAAGEIAAGVPLCEMSYHQKPRKLVTKSGGFGDPDIVPVIERYLRDC